jgi:hypothetical protein
LKEEKIRGFGEEFQSQVTDFKPSVGKRLKAGTPNWLGFPLGSPADYFEK